MLLAIHELLLALWTCEWLPVKDNVHSDPTVRSIILGQLNAFGALNPPEQVTPVLARLVYMQVRTTPALRSRF